MDEGAVLEVVRRVTAEVLPGLDPAAVTADGTTLTDLGANSIDRADIVTMAMEELGVVIPVRELGRVHDIGSLVALLQEYATWLSRST
ncbi:MAG TPA: phosphopantetheine-binding protein [Streptosporangiaceae bacterium]|jgi:polyketide biosynthesis acyl carrier protein